MPPLPTSFLLSRAAVPSRSIRLTSSKSIWPRLATQLRVGNGATIRPMHSSPVLCKKGGKQEIKKTVEMAKESAKPNRLAEDFTQLNEEIANAHGLMKDTLGKLRSGGKFNHELLEAMRVPLGKDTKHAVKLGDIAQVVPRSGRQVVVMVGEQDVCNRMLRYPFVISDQLLARESCQFDYSRLAIFFKSDSEPSESARAANCHTSADRGIKETGAG